MLRIKTVAQQIGIEEKLLMKNVTVKDLTVNVFFFFCENIFLLHFPKFDFFFMQFEHFRSQLY